MSEWKRGAAMRCDERRTKSADAPSMGKKRKKRWKEKPFIVEYKILISWYESRYSRIEDAQHCADKYRRLRWQVKTNFEVEP